MIQNRLERPLLLWLMLLHMYPAGRVPVRVLCFRCFIVPAPIVVVAWST